MHWSLEILGILIWMNCVVGLSFLLGVLLAGEHDLTAFTNEIKNWYRSQEWLPRFIR